jgi:hypothetical protein
MSSALLLTGTILLSALADESPESQPVAAPKMRRTTHDITHVLCYYELLASVERLVLLHTNLTAETKLIWLHWQKDKLLAGRIPKPLLYARTPLL